MLVADRDEEDAIINRLYSAIVPGDDGSTAPADRLEKLRQIDLALKNGNGPCTRPYRTADDEEIAYEIAWLERTLSYQLGLALIEAAQSLSGLRALPRRLLRLRKDALARRSGRSQQHGHRHDQSHLALVDMIVRAWAEQEPETILKAVLSRQPDQHRAAQALVDAAKRLRAQDRSAPAVLGRLAFSLDDAPSIGKWLAAAEFNAGNIRKAAELLCRREISARMRSPKDRRFRELVLDHDTLLAQGPQIPPRARAHPRRPGREMRILHVVNAFVPSHTTGYAIRSYNLARALADIGAPVETLTRPGYPWDRSDALPSGDGTAVVTDGVVCHRLTLEHSYNGPLMPFVSAAADRIEQFIRDKNITSVHAASNHVNALPALIAARRTGCPFVYEVRGLWELTAASRKQKYGAWEASERFELQRQLEVLVAREADAVAAITHDLARELIASGVPARPFTIMPNGVNANRLQPRRPAEVMRRELGIPEGRFMLGYFGSFEPYEGLAELLVALQRLIHEGADIGLLLIGSGSSGNFLLERAIQLGIEEHIIMMGRLPSEELADYYPAVEAMAFPRLPYRVCEIVEPMKPLEAMAAGKTVIVSSVNALASLVRHGETGLVFPKGDVDGLVCCLRTAMASPALRRKLGEQARAFVATERDWRGIARKMLELHQDLHEAKALPARQ